jgi:hypothetical protein
MTQDIQGVFSDEMVLEEEDQVGIYSLRVRLLAELRPEGALETLLADRIVPAVWRLHRLIKAEETLMGKNPTDFFSRRSRVAADVSLYEGTVETGLYKAMGELRSLQVVRRAKEQGETRGTLVASTIEITEEGIDLTETVQDIERQLIKKAIDQAEGSKMGATRLLGISLDSLRYRLEKLGLS